MDINVFMFVASLHFWLVTGQENLADRYLGIRGKEFVGNPMYSQSKQSRSLCSEQFVGFYANIETGCQTYHTCYRGSQNTFQCPTGTLFNQLLMTCDFWYKVRCNNAPKATSSPEVTTPSTTKKPIYYSPEEPEWTYAWHKLNPKAETEKQSDWLKHSAPHHIERENKPDEKEHSFTLSQERQSAEAPNPWLFPGGFIETLSN